MINMDNLKNHPLYQVHTLDTVFNSLWDFYKNNFAKLFAMSLIMAAVLQYAASFIDFASLQNETDINVIIEKMQEFIVPIGIIAVINIFFSVIIQHYILFNPLDENSSILNSFLRSFKYLLPYIVTLILLSIFGAMAMALGAIFIIGIIFAAIYVITLYMFILPIMMMESINISYTINRTFKLAHKNFWTNFGWVAVFMALFILLSIFISALILAPFTGNFLRSIFSPDASANIVEITKTPLYIALSIIAGAITMPLMPMFSTLLYLNGRAKEESGTQNNFRNEERKVTVEDLYAKPYNVINLSINISTCIYFSTQKQQDCQKTGKRLLQT